MKERSSQYTWIPLWVDKWLFGSTRIELQPDERSVWVDLMALASKDDGFIRANETTPYQDEQLAGLLFIPIELLRRTIEKCLDGKINKITKTEQGTLYINNWNTYKLSKRHQSRIEDKIFVPKYKKALPCPIEFIEMASKKGYVGKSRLLMAFAINRPLTKDEEVHYIDANENNDSISSLMLFATHKDHLQFQHGYDIKPIFDGSKIDSATEKDIMSKLATHSATILSAAKKDTILREDNIKIREDKNNIYDKKSEKFEIFWQQYPSRNGKKLLKADARDFFIKEIKDEEFEDLMKAVGNYLNSKTVSDGYVRDAIRFLKKGYWRSWIEPEIPSQKKGRTYL